MSQQNVPSSSAAGAKCPIDHGAEYCAFEHEGAYAFLADARENEPIFFSQEIGCWVVTRREDVISVLRDPARFSASITLTPIKPLPAGLMQFLRGEGFSGQPIQVDADPPVHSRARELTGQFLNAKRYATLEPQIRSLACQYIEKMKGTGTVDIVDAMTYELPARVLLLLLGAPDVDARRIKAWGNNRLMMIFGSISDQEIEQAGQELLDFFLYCRQLVEDRQSSPKDDYASALLRLRDGDDSRLTINEVVNLVFGLMLAGHETTTNGTGNVLYELLSNREQWEKIVSDPSLIPNAVEEGLRFASPVFSWRRRATENVQIGGVSIPEGSSILLALGSANHDAAQFTDPETFDVCRANARSHIAFGNGIHFCLGAPLARLEIKVILEELTAAFPKMRLSETQHVDWVRTISFRGPTKLLVELNE